LTPWPAENVDRLDPPFWMAPMAGVTDAAFRARLRRNGCRGLSTEMISASALARGNRKTLAELRAPDLGTDLMVQIVGSNVEDLAEAAARVQEAGFTHVDFNMGCPVRKVVRTGAGAALLADLPRAARCITALRRSVRGRLSVKIRSGWDHCSVNCVAAGRVAEDCGADRVTLHPRTRAQGYSGLADWSLVEALARAVTVPVLGNGDVATGAEAAKRLRTAGCAGVMIGRAALGRPWIFREAEAGIDSRAPCPPPSRREIREDLRRQLTDLLRWKGERAAVFEMRKFLGWTAKGMPGAAEFRHRVQRAEDLVSLQAEIGRFFADGDATEGASQPAARRDARGETIWFP
jgi:tRNA-dihydrouridine synthase B